MSDTYRDFGTVSVSTVIAPDKADEVEAAIITAARELRDAPVTADLLVAPAIPMLESIAKKHAREWLLDGV